MLERQFRELPPEGAASDRAAVLAARRREQGAAGDVRRQGGRGRQRLLHRRIAPAQRLARPGLVPRPGHLPGRGEAAQPADVDFRREVVAQPGRRRQGAAAIRRQTSGGRTPSTSKGRAQFEAEGYGGDALRRRRGRARGGRRQDRRPQPRRSGPARSATASSRGKCRRASGRS